ncbi:hypothetical protein DAPPUDRAFT_244260 [Daphnia pulex]|uniref:Uncharacterized protein n=1 Tax=Daphnia pulex TaxID=6669 RepID=E9GKJ9_DAPPU|nr:hypothetical protein DAPPUDRAFT_244260 [Daphnia pulex]|eukprot:EFX80051.1 hypothetical protein DAPPUDRAFT_244260 [Daphnia pulex]
MYKATPTKRDWVYLLTDLKDDKSDSQEAQDLFNDVWTVAELISHEYVRLNTVKFKLPSRYGFWHPWSIN